MLRITFNLRRPKAITALSVATLIALGVTGNVAFDDPFDAAAASVRSSGTAFDGELSDLAASVAAAQETSSLAQSAVAAATGHTGAAIENLTALRAAASEIVDATWETQRDASQIRDASVDAALKDSELLVWPWAVSGRTEILDRGAAEAVSLGMTLDAAVDPQHITELIDAVNADVEAETARLAEEARIAAEQEATRVAAEQEAAATSGGGYGTGGDNEGEYSNSGSGSSSGGSGRAHAEAIVRSIAGGVDIVWDNYNCGGMGACGYVLFGSTVHLSPNTVDSGWFSAAGEGVAAHEAIHALQAIYIEKMNARYGWDRDYDMGFQESMADCGLCCSVTARPGTGVTRERMRLLNICSGGDENGWFSIT